MANIKSAKKRILVNKTKADRNKAIKSGVKTSVKKVYTAIEAGDKAAAQAALLAATSTMIKQLPKVYTQKYSHMKGVSSFQSCKPDGIIQIYNSLYKKPCPIPSCRTGFFCVFRHLSSCQCI